MNTKQNGLGDVIAMYTWFDEKNIRIGLVTEERIREEKRLYGLFGKRKIKEFKITWSNHSFIWVRDETITLAKNILLKKAGLSG